MQAAHPLAVTGLLAHSTAMDEPYDRLARTAEVMSTIGFGSREDADRITRHVRAMHRRVRGRIRQPAGAFPAGTPYRADQPDLLMWVLFTLVDSALVVYRLYVREARARRSRPRTGRTTRSSAGCSGCATADMPDTLGDLREYKREMLEGDTLMVTDWARRRAREIVLEPPIPLVARPLLETVNFITIALLPDACGASTASPRCRPRSSAGRLWPAAPSTSSARSSRCCPSAYASYRARDAQPQAD